MNLFSGVKAFCALFATDSATKTALAIAHVTQQGNDMGSGTTWTRRFIWDTNADLGEVKIDDVELVADVEDDGSGGVQLWEGGPYWAICNVGASKPEEYGLYFWWGDTVGHASDWYFDEDHCPTFDKRISDLQSLGYIDSTGNLAPSHDAARAHWGAPWRMPTDAEFAALRSNCDTQWTARNGVNGRLVKGRGAYSSKSIFLPAAGCGCYSYLYNLGSDGYCWSSSPSSDMSFYAWILYFSSGYFYRDDFRYNRFIGRSVRPVRGFAKDAENTTSPVSSHLSLDNQKGARVAATAEQIRFSPAWESATAGATAVLSVNGEVVKSATDAGVYEWTPSPLDGNYELTHVVYANGVQVGETLTATFVAGGIVPRGCDWTKGTIELGWFADAQSQNPITYNIYWSGSADPASCVGDAGHLVGTKTFYPTGTGVQELTISDDQYLTHGDGMNPIYYHIVGTDGYQSCSRRMRNRHGLFVGIDKYADPALLELGSCVKDAQKWRDMYTANLGASNPRLMTDSNCTKEAVLGALGDFAAAAQIGDVFLYTHSSHGDYDLLRCYDSRKSNASSNISANEFANALKQFRKGVGVVVVLDACSSGTIPPAMNAPKLMAAKSSPVLSAPTSKSFIESVISAMGASNKSPRLLMSATPTALQSSSTEERITSGSEIGWLTAVNETEDSRDGVFSESCLLTAGWKYGGADRRSSGNGDGYVDFGELGRFAKYWCGRMYDQYGMSPQMFSEDILNNIRAGRVTDRNYRQFLATPQNVAATTDRNDGIEVTWTPVNGAVAYWVCFSSKDGELHAKLVEGDSWLIQSTDDYSVAFGQPFQIYVKAWNLMDVSERSETVVGVRSAHYTLKFDANGGIGEMPDEEFVVGIEKSLPLNAFGREGYTFGGWGLAPNSVAAAYEDGEVVTEACTLDGASDTLYAMWIPDVIKVTFNYGPFAGKFGPRVFDYTVGTAFHNFPIVTSTKWDVKGWFTAPAGGVRCQAGEVLPFTKDGTLYLHAEYSGVAPHPDDDLDDVWTDQLTIDSAELPPATEMVDYEVQLECSGGAEPYSWWMSEDGYRIDTETSSFAEVGEAQGWREDDGWREYELPFAFNCCGHMFKTVFVGDNASLKFDDAFGCSVIESGFGDLYSEGPDQDVFVEQFQDRVTFRWRRVKYWERDNVVNYAVTLYSNGVIRCSFGECTDAVRSVEVCGDLIEGAYVEQEGDDDIVLTPNYLPIGLSLDEDGIISGVPEQAGHYDFEVMVQDDEGEVCSKRLSIDVAANPNQRPMIRWYDPYSYEVSIRSGGCASFSVMATDPDGDELTYRWYFDGEEIEGADGASYELNAEGDNHGWHTLVCEVTDGLWPAETCEWEVAIGGELFVRAEDGEDALQRVVGQAMVGDVIYVGPGTYSPIEDWMCRSLRIVATDGWENTIIDGGQTSSCVQVCNYWSTNDMIRLEGFTLENGAGDFGGGADGAWLIGCVVRNNAAEFNGGGVAYGRADNCLIVGNTAQYGGGTAYVDLYNCTVVGNVAEQYNGGRYGGTEYNSIIWGNESAYDDSNVDDPLFVDADNGDYRLSEGSPCIGMGENSYVVTSFDLAGNSRIQCGSVDLGAYESGHSLPRPKGTSDLWLSPRIYGMILGWSDTTCAKWYKVYRVDDTLDDSAAELIATVSDAWYEDNSAVYGMNYRYWVVPWNETGEGERSDPEVGGLLPPLNVVDAKLPDATSGSEYEFALQATGGDGCYSWSVPTYDVKIEEQSTFEKVGEPMGWFVDDASWEYELPFDFPLGEEAISVVEVNDNGYLVLPFESEDVTVLAALGLDLYANPGDIYVSRTDNAVTFRWERVIYGLYEHVDVSATLYANGSIRLSCAGGATSVDRGLEYHEADFWYGVPGDIVLTPNALPSGLELSDDGVLFGEPMGDGTYRFVVKVEDGNCEWMTHKISLKINGESSDPIPYLGDSPSGIEIYKALEGSADSMLQDNITDGVNYNAYRAWAAVVRSSVGSVVAGAQAVRNAPFAWVSFATDSAALLAKMPTDDDLKVEEFKPSATAGSFDFTVSVKDVTIGDKASEDNLKKLFGLEGAESLDSAAFSSENVSLDFKEPQDGKLKFTATPAVDNAKSFFMKVKVK